MTLFYSILKTNNHLISKTGIQKRSIEYHILKRRGNFLKLTPRRDFQIYDEGIYVFAFPADESAHGTTHIYLPPPQSNYATQRLPAIAEEQEQSTSYTNNPQPTTTSCPSALSTQHKNSAQKITFVLSWLVIVMRPSIHLLHNTTNCIDRITNNNTCHDH